MKHSIKTPTSCKQKLMLLLMLVMLPQLSSAYDFMVDGLCYNYNEDGKSVTLTYEGETTTSLPYYKHYNYQCTNFSDLLVIPETVTFNGKTYSVTAIGVGAFESCAGDFKSVIIPNSVTEIGSRAFDCTNLSSVTIGNSVTMIGSEAFRSCHRLTSIIIPNSVTSIGDWAFYSCDSLTSVTFGDSLEAIGSHAFSSKFKSITFPSSMKMIYESAFSSIGEEIHLKSMEPFALGRFNFCKNTVVYVPTGCVELYKNHNDWNKFVIVEEGTSGATGVGQPFKINGITYTVNDDCKTLSAIDVDGNGIIPETVKNGDMTYQVTSINMEDSKNVTSVTIPNSVTEIPYKAFDNCSNLKSVTIPSSVKKIGYSAFNDCKSLTKVNISDLAAWCNIDFGGWSSNPLYYAHNLYLNGKLVTNLIVPNSVTKIGEYCFYGCTSLTTVSLPNSVTEIDNFAFDSCKNLETLTLGNSIEKIFYEAFNRCENILVKYNGTKSLKELGWRRGPDEYSGRAATAQEIRSVGRSAFNNLKDAVITRGMKLNSIFAYDEITNYENDGDYIFDCDRIRFIQRNHTYNNKSYYTVKFDCGRCYDLTIVNGVVTSVSY